MNFIINYIINNIFFSIPESIIILTFICIGFKINLYQFKNIFLVSTMAFLSFNIHSYIPNPYDKIVAIILFATLFKLSYMKFSIIKIVIHICSAFLFMLLMETLVCLPIVALLNINLNSIFDCIILSIVLRIVELGSIILLDWKVIHNEKNTCIHRR